MATLSLNTSLDFPIIELSELFWSHNKSNLFDWTIIDSCDDPRILQLMYSGYNPNPKGHWRSWRWIECVFNGYGRPSKWFIVLVQYCSVESIKRLTPTLFSISSKNVCGMRVVVVETGPNNTKKGITEIRNTGGIIWYHFEAFILDIHRYILTERLLCMMCNLSSIHFHWDVTVQLNCSTTT